MAFVVTGRCLGERYGACVDVCPCGCFHYGDHDGAPMMVIDQEACIDCGACLPECPLGAIEDETADVPEWREYNAAAAAMWPSAHDQPDGWQQRDPTEPPHNPANAA